MIIAYGLECGTEKPAELQVQVQELQDDGIATSG